MKIGLWIIDMVMILLLSWIILGIQYKNNLILKNLQNTIEFQNKGERFTLIDGKALYYKCERGHIDLEYFYGTGKTLFYEFMKENEK